MNRYAALARCALLAGLLLTTGVRAGPTGEPEPALRARLEAAIKDAREFDDRYAAEVWFVDMSARLARYVPKALPDAGQRLDFLRVVHAEAARAGVSPELVLAVINVESGFDRYAISVSGAEGYMQIMPFWLAEVGAEGDNLFDPRTNLRMGCTILRYYLDQAHDSYVKALARYNGSSGKPDYPYRVLELLNRRWSPN